MNWLRGEECNPRTVNDGEGENIHTELYIFSGHVGIEGRKHLPYQKHG